MLSGNNQEECEMCTEFSKHPVGWWDGEDDNGKWVSGYLYDCENCYCPIKRARDNETVKASAARSVAAIKNRENGIDIGLIEKCARGVGISIWDMSKRLGIRPSEWSEQISGQKAMEPGIAIRAIGEILKEKEKSGGENQ